MNLFVAYARALGKNTTYLNGRDMWNFVSWAEKRLRDKHYLEPQPKLKRLTRKEVIK